SCRDRHRDLDVSAKQLTIPFGYRSERRAVWLFCYSYQSRPKRVWWCGEIRPRVRGRWKTTSTRSRKCGIFVRSCLDSTCLRRMLTIRNERTLRLSGRYRHVAKNTIWVEMHEIAPDVMLAQQFVDLLGHFLLSVTPVNSGADVWPGAIIAAGG